ncbi:hypothetical protein IFO70_33295 [Phormidium tenue FACHB-886]|nr:hypothetical protein [Phormidium tenue FACHB-886]
MAKALQRTALECPEDGGSNPFILLPPQTPNRLSDLLTAACPFDRPAATSL